MTTVAFISDIHSNLTALDAVLDDMPPVDELICLGDVVGYGPHPSACVERVREEADTWVVGNHELAVLNGYDEYYDHEMAYEGFKHSDASLSTDQKEFLGTLPEETDAIGGQVRLVHSHPDPDIRWTRDGYIKRRQFTGLVEYLEGHDVLAFGHTHDQHAVNMAKYQSHGIILNPGSVGQPRDKDPRAAYATVNLDEMEVSLHRVEYDIAAVQRDINDAGLPSRTGERLANGE